MKINAQIEEWIGARKIVRTVLRVHVLVYCCNNNELMAMEVIKYANYSLGCCVFSLRQSLAGSRNCE
jgi:hypothetical protein